MGLLSQSGAVVPSGFFFADVNNKTVHENLTALRTQSAVAHFIERNQGKSPAEIQRNFGALLDALKRLPAPRAGEGEGDGDRPHD